MSLDTNNAAVEDEEIYLTTAVLSGDRTFEIRVFGCTVLPTTQEKRLTARLCQLVPRYQTYWQR